MLVHSLVPEMTSFQEVFPISEEEMAERLEQSEKHLELLCFIENKLFYVNTELVINEFMKLTEEPKQSIACCH